MLKHYSCYKHLQLKDRAFTVRKRIFWTNWHQSGLLIERSEIQTGGAFSTRFTRIAFFSSISTKKNIEQK